MKIALSFGVLLLVVVSAGAGGYYLASRNDDDNGGPVSRFDQGDVTEELTVEELETSYGVEPSPSEVLDLPTTITVVAPESIVSRLSAYRAAGQVVLGPTGWTGSGSVGANGNRSLGIHPLDGSPEAGQSISVYLASPGTGNAICPAAPYNSWIRDNWDELCGSPFGPAPTAAPGVTDATGHIVRYTLQADSGLEKVGGTFSEVRDQDGYNYGFFSQVEVSMPVEEHDLAVTIVDFFLATSKP